MKLVNNSILVDVDFDIGFIANNGETLTNEDLLFLCHTSQIFTDEEIGGADNREFKIYLDRCFPSMFYDLNIDLICQKTTADFVAVTAEMKKIVNYNDKGMIYIFVKTSNETKIFRMEDIRKKFDNLVEVLESEDIFNEIKNLCESSEDTDDGCNFFGCVHNLVQG